MAVAFHAVFGVAYVGACPLAASARLLATDSTRLRFAAYVFGGKAVLLFALSGASYLLSTLVAGRRAGCVRAATRRSTLLLTRTPGACLLFPCSPLLIWAANCGALLWVQARRSRCLKARLARLEMFTMHATHVHR